MNQKILSDKVLNERENAFYSHFMSGRQISVLPPDICDNPERFIAYIKKNRENLNSRLSDFEFDNFISDMRLKCKASLVPLEKIAWIGSNERACLFSWYQLMKFIKDNDTKIKKDLFERGRFSFKEEYLEGRGFPSDSSAQIRQILRTLDLLSDKQLRNNWIEETKSRWIRAFKTKSPFNYLFPEDEHECVWTWSYLKDKSIALGNLIDFPGSTDIYHAINLSFDIWVTDELTLSSEVQKFRNSFNKAKAQRKYKKNQEEKINVQFFLDVKTREYLKTLSRLRRRNTGELLHDLIVEEYQRLKHSK
ncbi:hypothetical protein ACN09C_00480 [Serratia fonticola]|uniref:hypothetical protein n=1 Tax=Serratia fonticola TaxID=47917 RepID=UPI003B00869E